MLEYKLDANLVDLRSFDISDAISSSFASKYNWTIIFWRLMSNPILKDEILLDELRKLQLGLTDGVSLLDFGIEVHLFLLYNIINRLISYKFLKLNI